MTTRSFFDLATGVCVMRPDPADVPRALRPTLEFGTDEEVREAFGAPERGVARSFKGPFWNMDTHLHEAVHFWQALCYPFVFWNSLHSWRLFLELFQKLNVSITELHDWRLPPLPGLNLMTEPLARAQRRLPQGGRMPPASALDLLETAVSITQWRLSSRAADRSHGAFLLWAKRNSSYPEMVRWLARIVNDEPLALAIFLPLCGAAFETTNPIRAFIELAKAYVSRFPSRCTVDNSQMRTRTRSLLSELRYDKVVDPQNIDTLRTGLMGLPFWRISRASVVEMRFGPRNWPHPILYRPARRLLDEASSRPDLQDLLDFPEMSPTTLYCFETFQPLIFARYDFPSRTRVVSIGDASELDLVSRVEEAAPGSSGKASFVDQHTLFGAVRRATGAFYADDVRLCPHTECPEYNHNYCNSWVFIHKTYQECGFRTHFDWLRESYRRVQLEMQQDKQRPEEPSNGPNSARPPRLS